eukprot:TRINITY_DN21722_c0_g1_i1.p1 TRINITY_DN21722_c0_g1~~TRINITY_DN21722_c0_g1_i1.p1  ORF type:complete len:1029 (-),score=115.82 TRINITY_DN21722_c0_g1_i1:90-3176(-)
MGRHICMCSWIWLPFACLSFPAALLHPANDPGFEIIPFVAVGDAGDWLEKWLQSLEIVIPDIHQTSGNFNIDITNGHCEHFDLGAIESSQQHPQDLATMTAKSLATSCSMHWSVKEQSFPWLGGHGDLTAAIADSTIGGTVILVPDSQTPILPQAIQTPGCQSSIKVTDLEFSGSVESWILKLLTPILKPILTKTIGQVICKALDKVIITKGSAALQDANMKIRKMLDAPSDSPIPKDIPDPNNNLIDFGRNTANTMLTKIMRLLNDPTKPDSFNAMIKRASANGTLPLNIGSFLPFKHSFTLGTYGAMSITVQAMSMKGVDTMSAMQLGAKDARQVAMALGFRNLSFEAQIYLEVEPSHGPIHGGKLIENFNFSMWLPNFSTHGTTFLTVNQTKLGQLTIDQLPSLGCLQPAVHSAVLTEADLSLPWLKVSLTPIGEKSLEADVDHMLEVLLGSVLKEFSASVIAVTNHTVSVTLRDKANKAIQHALSAGVCPAPENEYVSSWVVFAGAVLSSILAVLGLLMFPACRFCRKWGTVPIAERGESVRAITTTSHVSSATVVSAQSELHSNHEELAESLQDRRRLTDSHEWDCLAFHPRVSPGFRWGLPLLVLTVICMFITSNSGLGTAVYAQVLSNNQEVVHLPPVFGFSLISSVVEMWKSQAYPLAILVAFFSGIWPYIKLCMMLFCWFMPTSHLSSTMRLKLLEFLDDWGKWSLLDTFVMVMFMVGFKMDITAPNSNFPSVNQFFEAADTDLQIFVRIKALPGFYLFMGATVSSLVLGTLMTANHRYALKLGEYSTEALAQQTGRARLCNKLRPAGPTGRFFVYGPVVALGFSLALVLVGAYANSFVFEFTGLVAWILGKDMSHRPSSILALAAAVPEASGAPHAISTACLQIVFLLFSFVVVVLYHCALLVLWCAPLSHRLQTHVFVCCQIMKAWSGLDVFVVCIFACITEIEMVAKEIIGHKCDLLNTLIGKLPISDQIPGEKICFHLGSALDSGFWILLPAATISSIVGSLMISRCKSALMSGA